MIDHTLSLRAQIAALEQGTWRPSDLTQHYLERIAKLNPQLNALISIQGDHALEQAEKADQRRQAGAPLSPVDGIPIIHKDIFCTRQGLTTCGSRMLNNYQSVYESTATQRCLDAGMVTLGKANMDEFAMGATNETSAFGACHNPWNLDHVPGGSSGGSAAAVAADLATVATGTDTGGSIRQPASYCGITGIKPTYGRVSRHGMVAFASSLDQGGPMGHSAEDCAYLLSVMAGHDPKDATSSTQPVDDYVKKLDEPAKPLTLGYPRSWLTPHLSDDMAKHMDHVLDLYRDLGYQWIDIDLNQAELAVAAYYIIAPCECSANLARYDGVRYGHRSDDTDTLIDLYKNTRSEGFGDEVKRRILTGTFCLSSGFYDAYYVKAQQVRTLIHDAFKRAFGQCDAILMPTAPTTAPRLGGQSDDPVDAYRADLFTIPANLAGLPAISAPCGFQDGLPVGFQLIGRPFDETTLLKATHHYQAQSDWHQQRPSEGGTID